jgi:pilus assembly protein Flp/PilA
MLFAPSEKGQGLVEYAIILVFVAIVVIAVMRLLGPKIGNTFSTINSSLPEPSPPKKKKGALSFGRAPFFTSLGSC